MSNDDEGGDGSCTAVVAVLSTGLIYGHDNRCFKNWISEVR